MGRRSRALQNRVSISSDVCAKAKKAWRLGADKFTILLVGLQHFGGLVVLLIHYVCAIFPQTKSQNRCPSEMLALMENEMEFKTVDKGT